MQTTRGDLKRVFLGKHVLGALAGILIVSGMTTASVFVDAGAAFAAMLAAISPPLSAYTDALIFGGLYLEAVVVGTVYRGSLAVYGTLQRRRERVLSSA